MNLMATPPLLPWGQEGPVGLEQVAREAPGEDWDGTPNQTVPRLEWTQGSNKLALVTHHLSHDSRAHRLCRNLPDIAQMILLSKYEQHHPNQADHLHLQK